MEKEELSVGASLLSELEVRISFSLSVGPSSRVAYGFEDGLVFFPAGFLRSLCLDPSFFTCRLSPYLSAPGGFP